MRWRLMPCDGGTFLWFPQVFHDGLHLLAELVLFGAQRLELAECGTLRLVGGNREIYRRFVVAACSLRALDGLRVVAQELRINHPSILFDPRLPSLAMLWPERFHGASG